MGSYRYRSLTEGLYALQRPYGSTIYPKLPTCSFLSYRGLKKKQTRAGESTIKHSIWGVSENSIGDPQYSTLKTRILIVRTFKRRYP